MRALLTLADALQTIATIGDPSVGTTVTPTTAHAGTARNTVPDTAVAEVDVRGESADERRNEVTDRSDDRPGEQILAHSPLVPPSQPRR